MIAQQIGKGAGKGDRYGATRSLASILASQKSGHVD